MSPFPKRDRLPLLKLACQKTLPALALIVSEGGVRALRRREGHQVVTGERYRRVAEMLKVSGRLLVTV